MSSVECTGDEHTQTETLTGDCSGQENPIACQVYDALVQSYLAANSRTCCNVWLHGRRFHADVQLMVS